MDSSPYKETKLLSIDCCFQYVLVELETVLVALEFDFYLWRGSEGVAIFKRYEKGIKIVLNSSDLCSQAASDVYSSYTIKRGTIERCCTQFIFSWSAGTKFWHISQRNSFPIIPDVHSNLCKNIKN
jgi:hypothetical protein